VWKRVLAYVNGECRRLWGRSIRSRGAENQNDEWVLTVSVIFQDANGQEILRHARAKVDTGNPKNLISPAFTAQFGFAFDAANERVILELPGGGLYVSTAKLAGRWSCKVNSSRNSPFKFDPKFMDAEFEVSNTDERFDVVIGSDTISEERLLEWGPGIALTGFRTKLKTYNGE
jgi:hypothetical protein